MPSATAYLDALNSQQLRAVEHGISDLSGASGGPLLVIAGAGSGKTNTLAHRVAHLIVNGGASARSLLSHKDTTASKELSQNFGDGLVGQAAAVMG